MYADRLLSVFVPRAEVMKCLSEAMLEDTLNNRKQPRVSKKCQKQVYLLPKLAQGTLLFTERHA